MSMLKRQFGQISLRQMMIIVALMTFISAIVVNDLQFRDAYGKGPMNSDGTENRRKGRHVGKGYRLPAANDRDPVALDQNHWPLSDVSKSITSLAPARGEPPPDAALRRVPPSLARRACMACLQDQRKPVWIHGMSTLGPKALTAHRGRHE
jgi:hypothetical protein